MKKEAENYYYYYYSTAESHINLAVLLSKHTVLEILHISASNDYFSVELSDATIKSQLQIPPHLYNTAHLDIYKPFETHGTVSLTHDFNSYMLAQWDVRLYDEVVFIKVMTHKMYLNKFIK